MPLSDRVPMPAVGADNVIIRSDRGYNPGGDGFLTQIWMQVSVDLANAVLLNGSFLEPSDGERSFV
jgi:hypothetical protein